MTARVRCPGEPTTMRWKAVWLGLRLAGNSWGVGAIGCFAGLWCLIGVILCLICVPFAAMGKMPVFYDAVNSIGLYGFLWPLGLMAAATWAVQLLARLLWCGVHEPPTATFLALASVAGRLSVLFVLGSAGFWSVPLGKGLLLPETIACSVIAWLGLAGDYGFIRTLRREWLPAADAVTSSAESDAAAEGAKEAGGVIEQKRGNALTSDVGEWFKRRFPRAHTFAVWILLPVGYVTVSSLAGNGDPGVIPQAILRLAVLAPVFLQVFKSPGDKLEGLLQAG